MRHEKRKFAKRTWNVSWNQQINFLVRSTDPVAEGSHTSQKARCMCHPRLVLAARAHPTVGNEAGMYPGINRFTKRAPIADWVRRGVPLWCSRIGSGGAPVGWAWNGRAVKALPYSAAGETRKTKFAKRTWNVSWNQQINFFGAVHRPRSAEARTAFCSLLKSRKSFSRCFK